MLDLKEKAAIPYWQLPDNENACSIWKSHKPITIRATYRVFTEDLAAWSWWSEWEFLDAPFWAGGSSSSTKNVLNQNWNIFSYFLERWSRKQKSPHKSSSGWRTFSCTELKLIQLTFFIIFVLLKNSNLMSPQRVTCRGSSICKIPAFRLASWVLDEYNLNGELVPLCQMLNWAPICDHNIYIPSFTDCVSLLILMKQTASLHNLLQPPWEL